MKRLSRNFSARAWIVLVVFALTLFPCYTSLSLAAEGAVPGTGAGSTAAPAVAGGPGAGAAAAAAGTGAAAGIMSATSLAASAAAVTVGAAVLSTQMDDERPDTFTGTH